MSLTPPPKHPKLFRCKKGSPPSIDLHIGDVNGIKQNIGKEMDSLRNSIKPENIKTDFGMKYLAGLSILAEELSTIMTAAGFLADLKDDDKTKLPKLKMWLKIVWNMLVHIDTGERFSNVDEFGKNVKATSKSTMGFSSVSLDEYNPRSGKREQCLFHSQKNRHKEKIKRWTLSFYNSINQEYRKLYEWFVAFRKDLQMSAHDLERIPNPIKYYEKVPTIPVEMYLEKWWLLSIFYLPENKTSPPNSPSAMSLAAYMNYRPLDLDVTLHESVEKRKRDMQQAEVERSKKESKRKQDEKRDEIIQQKKRKKRIQDDSETETSPIKDHKTNANEFQGKDELHSTQKGSQSSHEVDPASEKTGATKSEVTDKSEPTESQMTDAKKSSVPLDDQIVTDIIACLEKEQQFGSDKKRAVRPSSKVERNHSKDLTVIENSEGEKVKVDNGNLSLFMALMSVHKNLVKQVTEYSWDTPFDINGTAAIKCVVQDFVKDQNIEFTDIFQLGLSSHFVSITRDRVIFQNFSLLIEDWSLAHHILNKNHCAKSISDTLEEHEITRLTHLPKPFSTLRVSPKLSEMMNFSDEELKNVKSFSVSNDHGRIEWLGPIDARGLDLDSTVQITRGIVRVEYKEGTEPSKQHLNKAAKVTYFGLVPSKQTKKAAKKMEDKLKATVADQKATFTSYNSRTGQLEILVNHFSTYDMNRYKGSSRKRMKISETTSGLAVGFDTSVLFSILTKPVKVGSRICCAASSKLESAKEVGIVYPKQMCGVGKCHLRALFSIDPDLANQAIDDKLSFKDVDEIKKLVSDHSDDSCAIFQVAKTEHWVALNSRYIVDDSKVLEIQSWALAFYQLVVQEGEAYTYQQDFYPIEAALLPKPSNSLKMEPGYTKLLNMDTESLKTVQNFKVQNEFGSIRWLQPVDVRDLNLDEMIHIKHGSIRVEHDNLPEEQKRSFGNTLNSPAEVCFFRLTSLDPKKIAEKVNLKGMTFISYCQESGALLCRVEHFSVYNMLGSNESGSDESGSDESGSDESGSDESGSGESEDLLSNNNDGNVDQTNVSRPCYDMTTCDSNDETEEVEDDDDENRSPTQDDIKSNRTYWEQHSYSILPEYFHGDNRNICDRYSIGYHYHNDYDNTVAAYIPWLVVRLLLNKNFFWIQDVFDAVSVGIRTSLKEENLDSRVFVPDGCVSFINRDQTQKLHSFDQYVERILVAERTFLLVQFSVDGFPDHWVNYEIIPRPTSRFELELITTQVYGTTTDEDLKECAKQMIKDLYPNQKIKTAYKPTNRTKKNTALVRITNIAHHSVDDDGTSCGPESLNYMIQGITKFTNNTCLSDLNSAPDDKSMKFRMAYFITRLFGKHSDTSMKANHLVQSTHLLPNETNPLNPSDLDEYSLKDMVNKTANLSVDRFNDLFSDFENQRLVQCACKRQLMSSEPYMMCTSCFGTYHPRCLLLHYMSVPKPPIFCYHCGEKVGSKSKILLIPPCDKKENPILCDFLSSSYLEQRRRSYTVLLLLHNSLAKGVNCMFDAEEEEDVTRTFPWKIRVGDFIRYTNKEAEWVDDYILQITKVEDEYQIWVSMDMVRGCFSVLQSPHPDAPPATHIIELSEFSDEYQFEAEFVLGKADGEAYSKGLGRLHSNAQAFYRFSLDHAKKIPEHLRGPFNGDEAPVEDQANHQKNADRLERSNRTRSTEDEAVSNTTTVKRRRKKHSSPVEKRSNKRKKPIRLESNKTAYSKGEVVYVTVDRYHVFKGKIIKAHSIRDDEPQYDVEYYNYSTQGKEIQTFTLDELNKNAEKLRLGSHAMPAIFERGMYVYGLHPSTHKEQEASISVVYNESVEVIFLDDKRRVDLPYFEVRPKIPEEHDSHEFENWKRGHMNCRFYAYEGQKMLCSKNALLASCSIKQCDRYYCLVHYGLKWEDEWIPYALLTPLNDSEVLPPTEFEGPCVDNMRYKNCSCYHAKDSDSNTPLAKFIRTLSKKNDGSFIKDTPIDSDEESIIHNDFGVWYEKYIQQRRSDSSKMTITTFDDEGKIDARVEPIDDSEQALSSLRIQYKNCNAATCICMPLSSIVTCGPDNNINLSNFSQMSVSVLLMLRVDENQVLREIFERFALNNMQPQQKQSLLMLVHGAPNMHGQDLLPIFDTSSSFLSSMEVISAIGFTSIQDSTFFLAPSDKFKYCGDLNGVLNHIVFQISGDNEISLVETEVSHRAAYIIEEHLREREENCEDAYQSFVAGELSNLKIDLNDLSKIICTNEINHVTMDNEVGIRMAPIVTKYLNYYVNNHLPPRAHGEEVSFSAPLEMIALKNMAVYKRIGINEWIVKCIVCNKDCMPHTCFANLHDAICNAAMVGPLHLFVTKIASSDENDEREIEEFNICNNFLLHESDIGHKPRNFSKCEPLEQMNSCIGDDQLVMGSIRSCGGSLASLKAYIEFIELMGTDEFKTRVSDIERRIKVHGKVDYMTFTPPVLRLCDYTSTERMMGEPESFLEENLPKYIEDVFKIDSHDQSFPNHACESWGISTSVVDEIKKNCEDNGLKVHHILPMHQIISNIPEDDALARVYRGIPSVALPSLTEQNARYVFVFRSAIPRSVMEDEVLSYLKQFYAHYSVTEKDGEYSIEWSPSSEYIHVVSLVTLGGGSRNKKGVKEALSKTQVNKWRKAPSALKDALAVYTEGNLSKYRPERLSTVSLFPYVGKFHHKNEDHTELIQYAQSAYALGNLYHTSTLTFQRRREEMGNACFIENEIKLRRLIKNSTWPKFAGCANSTSPKFAGCAPDLSSLNLDLGYHSSLQFSISVNVESWNCSDNICNLLELLGYCDSTLKKKLDNLNSMKAYSEMFQCEGFWVFHLPNNLDMKALMYYVNLMNLPLVASLVLDYGDGVSYNHIIGVLPERGVDDEGIVTWDKWIIDGSFDKLRPVRFDEDHLNYCCGTGGFYLSGCSFFLVPGRKLTQKIVQNCQKSKVKNKNIKLYGCESKLPEAHREANVVVKSESEYREMLKYMKSHLIRTQQIHNGSQICIHSYHDKTEKQ